jgi:type I restriction-modification system DNA methylase subunit
MKMNLIWSYNQLHFPGNNGGIGIEEAATILSVSTATVRNWIKAGKIRNVTKHGRALVLDKDEIVKIKQEIESGRSHRLKSRRNKRAVDGNYVPTEYVLSSQYVRLTEEIVQIVGNAAVQVKPQLILLEVALNLLQDRQRLGYSNTLEDNSLSELAVEGRLDLGKYSDILQELYDFNMGISQDDSKVLREIRKLNIRFVEGDDLLGLVYMSLCSMGTRKNNGSYYTPTKLVDFLVKKSLQGLENVPYPKVIDPCCGSGNFLIKLFLELKLKFLAAGLTVDEAEKRLQQDCLFGYDIDETAVALAKINLALLLEGTQHDSVVFNIECRNTLENYGTLYGLSDLDSYDLVIGNPPWGYSFTRNEIESIKDRFISAQASLESFCLFIEYGISILKQHGVLSYVLPEALLNVQMHTTTRKLLLDEMELMSIQLLGLQFSNVFTPTITLIARKSRNALTHNVMIELDGKTYSIPQQRFYENEMYVFNVKASNIEDEIVEHMRSLPGVMFLKNNADFALGIVTGNNKEYVLNQQFPGAEPVLKGSDIFKYNFYPSENYIVFEPEKFQQVAPVHLYRAPEKLLYRFINENLVFAYDSHGTLSLNSANVVIPRLCGYSIKYVLAVLNSRPAQFFYTVSFSSVKVLRKHIESIPIPSCNNDIQERIVQLVDRLLTSDETSRREEIYEQIDEQIMDLYCLNLKQKNVIKQRFKEVKYLSR